MSAQMTYEEQLLMVVRRLTDAQKQEVLAFAETVSRPPGESGDSIIAHVRELDFDKEFLSEMKISIEEECERIEPFEDVNLDG
ncbi:MAG: hypothetical protein AAFQ07_13190 [Chloroflexota bacterium]